MPAISYKSYYDEPRAGVVYPNNSIPVKGRLEKAGLEPTPAADVRFQVVFHDPDNKVSYTNVTTDSQGEWDITLSTAKVGTCKVKCGPGPEMSFQVVAPTQVVTQPPVTQPPVTQPPVTQPPVTQPPGPHTSISYNSYYDEPRAGVVYPNNRIPVKGRLEKAGLEPTPAAGVRFQVVFHDPDNKVSYTNVTTNSQGEWDITLSTTKVGTCKVKCEPGPEVSFQVAAPPPKVYDFQNGEPRTDVVYHNDSIPVTGTLMVAGSGEVANGVKLEVTFHDPDDKVTQMYIVTDSRGMWSTSLHTDKVGTCKVQICVVGQSRCGQEVSFHVATPADVKLLDDGVTLIGDKIMAAGASQITMIAPTIRLEHDSATGVSVGPNGVVATVPTFTVGPVSAQIELLGVIRDLQGRVKILEKGVNPASAQMELLGVIRDLQNRVKILEKDRKMSPREES